ncbi:MAG: hypothetical protein ACYTDW_17920, partial [Planctomycetota bacterium]
CKNEKWDCRVGLQPTRNDIFLWIWSFRGNNFASILSELLPIGWIAKALYNLPQITKTACFFVDSFRFYSSIKSA